MHATDRDRVCEYCDGATQYSDGTNIPMCKDMSYCTYGQRVKTLGTATSDLVCGACDETSTQYYLNMAKHREVSCNIKQRCPVGTFVSGTAPGPPASLPLSPVCLLESVRANAQWCLKHAHMYTHMHTQTAYARTGQL